MKIFVGVLRFLAYVAILHTAVSWLSDRVFSLIIKITAGIDLWFSNGFWNWLLQDNRYSYFFLLFLTIFIYWLFGFVIKISYFPKATKIFTFFYVGVHILITGALGITFIISSSYSIGVQIISIVAAATYIAVFFTPFLLVASNFDRDFES